MRYSMWSLGTDIETYDSSFETAFRNFCDKWLNRNCAINNLSVEVIGSGQVDSHAIHWKVADIDSSLLAKYPDAKVVSRKDTRPPKRSAKEYRQEARNRNDALRQGYEAFIQVMPEESADLLTGDLDSYNLTAALILKAPTDVDIRAWGATVAKWVVNEIPKHRKTHLIPDYGTDAFVQYVSGMTDILSRVASGQDDTAAGRKLLTQLTAELCPSKIR